MDTRLTFSRLTAIVFASVAVNRGKSPTTEKAKEMTTREHKERAAVALVGLGFHFGEVTQLRRIASTLHRWGEAECNGEIQRGEASGKPFRHYGQGGSGPFLTTKAADREAGALRRLASIMAAHPELVAYHQGDCRGCSVYILKRSDVPAGVALDSIYNRGVAVQ